MRRPDDRLLLLGRGDGESFLAQFTADGHADPSFGSGGRVVGPWAAGAAALQADGKVVVAGASPQADRLDLNLTVRRLLEDGRPDPSFGDDGVVTLPRSTEPEWATAVGIAAGGRITVVGASGRYEPKGAPTPIVARLRSNGDPDPTYPGVNRADVGLSIWSWAAFQRRDSITFLPDGRMLWASSSGDHHAGPGCWRRGYAVDFTTARFDDRGLQDPSFAGGCAFTDFRHNDDAATMAIADRRGRVITGGMSKRLVGRFALVRHLPDGTLDRSFGVEGRAITAFKDSGVASLALAIQPDGRIVAVGHGDFLHVPSSDDRRLHVARYRGGSDRQRPRIRLRLRTPSRKHCGRRARLRVRVLDTSPVDRVVVRAGGRRLARSNSKHFAVTIRCCRRRRIVRVAAVDVAGNRAVRSIVVPRACSGR